MGRLVFVIVQLRMLRIQFAVSVLLAAVLLLRAVYWRCRGRNPYIYGFLWILPLAGLFAGKCRIFEGGLFGEVEAFLWTIFDEIPIFGAAYWAIAGGLCLTYLIRKRKLLNRGRTYRLLTDFEIGGKNREVRVSDLSHSPYTIGILHPYIVLPVDYESRYGNDERNMILLHEATHIRCRHNFFFLLASFITCIFWLNPLVHYSARVFQTDLEIFCDGIVAGRSNIAEYGRLILKSVMVTEPSAGLLQRVNFFFSKSECRSRIILLSEYRQAFRRHQRAVFWTAGFTVFVMLAAVIGSSRFFVGGGNGIEAVYVLDDGDERRLAQISMSDQDIDRIVAEETDEKIVVDTKALRERIRAEGYETGIVGVRYDTYRFGPGLSGICREQVSFGLYNSSTRYVELEKKLSGWKKWICYL